MECESSQAKGPVVWGADPFAVRDFRRKLVYLLLRHDALPSQERDRIAPLVNLGRDNRRSFTEFKRLETARLDVRPSGALIESWTGLVFDAAPRKVWFDSEWKAGEAGKRNGPRDQALGYMKNFKIRYLAALLGFRDYNDGRRPGDDPALRVACNVLFARREGGEDDWRTRREYAVSPEGASYTLAPALGLAQIARSFGFCRSFAAREGEQFSPSYWHDGWEVENPRALEVWRAFAGPTGQFVAHPWEDMAPSGPLLGQDLESFVAAHQRMIEAGALVRRVKGGALPVLPETNAAKARAPKGGKQRENGFLLNLEWVQGPGEGGHALMLSQLQLWPSSSPADGQRRDYAVMQAQLSLWPDPRLSESVVARRQSQGDFGEQAAASFSLAERVYEPTPPEKMRAKEVRLDIFSGGGHCLSTAPYFRNGGDGGEWFHLMDLVRNPKTGEPPPGGAEIRAELKIRNMDVVEIEDRRAGHQPQGAPQKGPPMAEEAFERLLETRARRGGSLRLDEFHLVKTRRVRTPGAGDQAGMEEDEDEA